MYVVLFVRRTPPGDLTVMAGMVAPQRDHKHVQRREVGQPTMAGPHLHREKVKRKFVVNASDKMPSEQLPHERRLDLTMRNDLTEIVLVNEYVLAHHVRQENPVCIQPFETHW
jgi:hypothetical protein